MTAPIASPALLTPAEVARLFRVDPKTVTRWAVAGKLTSVRTLGGHRRFHRDEVMNLLGDHRDAGPVQAPGAASLTTVQQP